MRYESENITLIHGDCMDYIGSFSGVRACITDPPYMVNTKSDGAGKLSPWADFMNAAFWYKEWFSLVRSVLRNDGCMWAFLNWRSLATYQKASADISWPIESLLVWDKCWIGPGGPKGLRPSYELSALFAQQDFRIENRGLADIQRFKWSSTKPTGHPAEKPENMMAFLIEHSSVPGDTIIDPFMGSGTVGAAAIKLGRRYIGIEQDERWFSYAKERILSPVEPQMTLSDLHISS